MTEAAARRILVIDDDSAVRSILAETLRGEGYLVDEAAHGAAGLEQVQVSTPDLILLDILMPVLDGYEFLERLRDVRGEQPIPVLLVSATHALPESPHELGVKAVLIKPFDVGMLVTMVDRLTAPARSDHS